MICASEILTSCPSKQKVEVPTTSPYMEAILSRDYKQRGLASVRASDRAKPRLLISATGRDGVTCVVFVCPVLPAHCHPYI